MHDNHFYPLSRSDYAWRLCALSRRSSRMDFNKDKIYAMTLACLYPVMTRWLYSLFLLVAMSQAVLRIFCRNLKGYTRRSFRLAPTLFPVSMRRGTYAHENSKLIVWSTIWRARIFLVWHSDKYGLIISLNEKKLLQFYYNDKKKSYSWCRNEMIWLTSPRGFDPLLPPLLHHVTLKKKWVTKNAVTHWLNNSIGVPRGIRTPVIAVKGRSGAISTT